MANMRTRARKRILDFVAQHPATTAGQIARALGMNGPAVRHHLTILLEDGRVESASGAQESGRGRPPRRFRISSRLDGDNLSLIADTALGLLTSAADRRTWRRLIDALADGLIEQLGPIDGRGPASMRLTAIVARLNTLHYVAHWEAGASGPRLFLGRCPYAAVIQNHPELCEMDARAVSKLAGTGAEQVAKIDAKSRAQTQCVFLLA
jgi:predicted ArsR family transcriptional regulator